MKVFCGVVSCSMESPMTPRSSRLCDVTSRCDKGAMMNLSVFQHHYATQKDVRLHYVTMGQGTPVVLLHGWPQTWYEWRLIMPLLADKYRLIAPDLRGLVLLCQSP